MSRILVVDDEPQIRQSSGARRPVPLRTPHLPHPEQT
jgi:hypothetical protein